jgi:hypothetical protein
VIDAATQAVLQDILRRESRSLLQYVRDAFPWTSAREQAALTELQKLIEEELKAAADLSHFLIRQRSRIPYIGPYPMTFTNINYVSLDHLLPLLVGNERRAIASLESDLRRIIDPAASAQVEKIVSMKQQHLKALESLATAHPETVAH